MPELTSILRQRLGAGEEPKAHPDADTLTAYVEDLLSAGERSQVLLHISLCTQCRDVVTLTMPEGVAVPEEEPAAIVTAALPVPRRWFLGPRFALAASLVAVAAGVVLVLEIPHPNQKAPVITASVQPQPQPATPSADAASDQAIAGAASLAGPEQEPAAAAHLPATELHRSGATEVRAASVLATGRERKAIITAQNQPVVIAGAVPQDYLNNEVFAFSAGLVSAPQPQELPRAPRPVRPAFAFSRQTGASGSIIQSSAFLEIAPPHGASGSQGTATTYTFASAERRNLGFASRITEVGKQFHLKRLAPAISTANANSYAMFSPGLSQSAPAEMAVTANKGNGLSGQALAQSPAFTTRAMASGSNALNQSENSFLWKISQGRLLKSSDMDHWIDGYPVSEGIEFSVVTASGADVWAGGKDASLVHSRDGGVTWERITLGASATGTINSIEVNQSTVFVRNSSGQGWISQDGGRSWSLQN